MIDPHKLYLSLQEDWLVLLLVCEFEMLDCFIFCFCWYQEATFDQCFVWRFSSFLHGLRIGNRATSLLHHWSFSELVHRPLTSICQSVSPLLDHCTIYSHTGAISGGIDIHNQPWMGGSLDPRDHDYYARPNLTPHTVWLAALGSWGQELQVHNSRSWQMHKARYNKQSANEQEVSVDWCHRQCAWHVFLHAGCEPAVAQFIWQSGYLFQDWGPWRLPKTYVSVRSEEFGFTPMSACEREHKWSYRIDDGVLRGLGWWCDVLVDHEQVDAGSGNFEDDDIPGH